MKNSILQEVLYSVFVEDTNAFKAFIEAEYLQAITCLDSEKDKILAEIDNQLDYIFARIKAEGACAAPSQKIELVTIMKYTFKK